MKDEILIELARRWEEECKTKNAMVIDAIGESYARGYRECKRECADSLKTLVSIFGGESNHSMMKP